MQQEWGWDKKGNACNRKGGTEVGLGAPHLSSHSPPKK